MEIYTNIYIEKFIIKVRLASERKDNIVAFGELWAYQNEKERKPFFKVKGFTLRIKQFSLSDEKVLSVVFPAYPSPKSKIGYQTSFIFESEEWLKKIRDGFIQEYSEISGGLPIRNLSEQETIKPEEIPL